MNQIKYTTWIKEYLPILNPYLLENKKEPCLNNLPLNGTLFGRTTLEQLKVNTFPNNQIWSVSIQNGSELLITPGNFENPSDFFLGNIITINPWVNSSLYALLSRY